MSQQKQSTHNFSTILKQFQLQGKPKGMNSYGSGHIHDTYRVINAASGYPDYLLQRINHHVFNDIPALTDNIRMVTTHVRNKLRDIPGSDPDKEVLIPVRTNQNHGYYQDSNGNFWRIYHYVKDSRSYDIARTPMHAYEAGKAFGKFLSLVSDLDATCLYETIPGFHNIANRLGIFERSIKQNACNRVNEITVEIDFVRERAQRMQTICNLGKQGILPLRTTHNDTKLNNVLFNKQDKAQCVIDLDTVMPGYIAYDFGDAIRTIANSAAEDEKDLDKIKVNVDLFTGFTRGFLKETVNFISEEELKSLVQGVLLLPFIMGLRFLTDYIDGDTYYKTSFPSHNLQRARAQFRLVEEFEKMQIDLDNTIRTIANSYRNNVATEKKSD